jgi:hypothetical protein
MTLQLLHSDFLIYEENLIFFFISEIADRQMNVEIGTEAAQFPEKEYMNGIFVAVFVYLEGGAGAGGGGATSVSPGSGVDTIRQSSPTSPSSLVV